MQKKLENQEDVSALGGKAEVTGLVLEISGHWIQKTPFFKT